MALKVKPTSDDRELPPEGQQTAICVQVVDLGTHISKGKFPREQRKVMITWELPECIMTTGEPFVASRRYTLSLNPKSYLRQDLTRWRGRDFSPEEFEEFDLTHLLLVKGQVQLAHVMVGQRTYVNVIGVTPLHKSLEKNLKTYKVYNQPRFFDLDEPDWKVFKQLPEWIRNTIAESPEYKAMEPDIPEDVKQKTNNSLPDISDEGWTVEDEGGTK